MTNKINYVLNPKKLFKTQTKWNNWLPTIFMLCIIILMGLYAFFG